MRTVALILRLQWLLFRNSLRATSGRLELAARVFVSGVMFCLSTLAGIALAGMTLATFGTELLFPLLGWVLVVLTGLWLLVPLMTATFGDSVDAARLRRYPLTSWQLVVVDLIVGAGDPWTILFYPLLAGIAAGVAIAEPVALATALPGLLLLALFCLATLRVIQRLVSGVFASRRRREIVIVVFILLLLTPQLVILWVDRNGQRSHLPEDPQEQVARMRERAEAWLEVVAWTPPVLAVRALAGAEEQGTPSALAGLAGVLAWAGIAVWVARRQLDRDFAGIAEGRAARTARTRGGPSTTRGLSVGLPGLTPHQAAVVEKEMRYVYRSPRALVTTVVPPVAAVLLAAGMPGAGPALAGSGFRLVGVTAYMLVAGLQLTANAFGLDRHGAKVYVLAPVRVRDVLIGKNVVAALVFAAQLVVVVVGTWILGGGLAADSVLMAACAAVVGLPLFLAAGNMLSTVFPKGVDPGSISGQGSRAGILVSLFVVLGNVVLFAFGPLIGWLTGLPWTMYTVFALEAIGAAIFYRWALGWAAGRIEERPEPFLAVLLAE